MNLFNWLLVFSFLFSSFNGRTQTLKGRVFDATTDSTLYSINIRNKTQGLLTQTSSDGRYEIVARTKDLIIVSSVGYKSDSLIVQEYMFSTGIDIHLKPASDTLSSVTVRARNYSADSLARRNEYRHILDEPLPGLSGGNSPSSGFGITISPFSYLSKKAKEERRLKQRLIHNEEQAYIDFRFSREYVQKLTGLAGDSLQTFMFRYRPTYTFCRSANDEDMFVYINNKLREYRTGKTRDIKN